MTFALFQIYDKIATTSITVKAFDECNNNNNDTNGKTQMDIFSAKGVVTMRIMFKQFTTLSYSIKTAATGILLICCIVINKMHV